MYCTALLFRGFEPGVFSLEVYKMVKISMKELKYFKQIITSVLQNGCPIVHDATTELPNSVNTGSNTTVLKKKLMLTKHWPGPPFSIR